MNKVYSIAMALLLTTTLGCRDDAKAIWREGIKRCADNDLLGSKLLYFGPSNKFGPGTIFERFADGSVQVSYLASDYINDSVIEFGKEFDCKAKNDKTFKISGDVDLSKVTSIPIEISSKFERAKTLTVKTDSTQWVELRTGSYKQIVNKIPAENQIRKDLAGRHFVLSRALLVKGMTADLTFDSSVLSEIKGQLPTSVVAGGGSVNFKIEYKNTTTLTISSDKDFYIAGELRPYRNEGLASNDLGELIDASKLVFKDKLASKK